MRNALVATVALVMNVFCCAAQNLVPNPSFEEYTQCPWSLGMLEIVAPHWFSPTSTFPSYFNACANSSSPSFGVPNNSPGYQPARTGEAYAAIALYTTVYPNARIYIETQLTEPLEQDTIYCAEFFLSLCGDLWDMRAVADVGMHFSVDSIVDDQNDTLDYVPQVESNPDTILIDTVNWMKVSGTFVAQGGERYITIGNFLPDDQTNINTSSGLDAYYFIDDVSVMKCSQVGLSTNALVATNNSLNIYPNPASGKITITNPSNKKSTLQIIDAIGRVIQSSTHEPNIHQAVLDISDLPNGLYTIEIIAETLVSTHSKLVVLH